MQLIIDGCIWKQLTGFDLRIDYPEYLNTGFSQRNRFDPDTNPSCPITSIHLTIFDRWGGILCEEDDTTTGWNGYVDNRLLPPRTDVYILDISFQGGDTDRLSGNVILVR